MADCEGAWNFADLAWTFLRLCTTGALHIYLTMKSPLFKRAQAFSERLQRLKSQHLPPDSTWYGYDIMANVWVIEQLLGQRFEALLEQLPGPVADIGAADGDLGYFLESEGRAVHFLDWPATNWNGMRGIRHMHALLGSAAQIHEIDLDTQFTLPQAQYGLVCLLGILYHLKNPYYALETLAKSSHTLLLSTRIAAYAGPDNRSIRDLPVAYLVDTHECNNDPTNYWIFSATGLRRILQRAGWDILHWHAIGDTRRSNPADNDHDERAFVMARSRYFTQPPQA